MDDMTDTRELLNRQLDAAVSEDPLRALTAIGAVQRDMASRRQTAVRSAIQRHSWHEIGEALGVTKQAAHQKFAKEWASTLKEEIKAEHNELKIARREGSPERAAAAQAKRDALIAEVKNANRRRKASA
jgi:hypothetical protein